MSITVSTVDVLQFSHWFAGNSRCHGVTELTGEINKGKAECNSYLIHAAATSTDYYNHLSGSQGIGISPLMDDDTCVFGALDIDHCNYDLSYIVKAICDYNLPLLPCRSKSGKLHLYIFFREPTPAKDVIEILQWYRMAFGLSSKTEIFPKQTHTTVTQYPSWINLPYFGSTRTALFPESITLGEALLRMNDICITYKDHKEFLKSLYFYEAPPCIQSGILLRNLTPGERNNWLFAYGVFLLFKELDLNDYLSQFNASLSDPLSEKEIQSTVTGLQKKTYFYPCKSLPFCNKNLCRSQKYGYTYKLSSGLSYGLITQYLVDPPYYEWDVNGQTLIFYTESDLLNQNRFRELCLRQIHVVPRPVPNAEWSEIVNKACENMVIKAMDMPEEDLSVGSIFNNYVKAYFTVSRLSERIEDCDFDRIYQSKEDGLVYFSPKLLYAFITDVCSFKDFSVNEVRRRLLADFNARPPKPGMRLWSIDIELQKKQNTYQQSSDEEENEESDENGGDLEENGDIKF